MPLVLVFLLLLCLPVKAASVPDLVVFDEDDPLGRDYYDASVANSKAPSSLGLAGSSGDKMPVTTNQAARGLYSGALEWTSRPGGDWAVHLFRPGFPLLRADLYQNIEFALNGPAAVSAEALPRLELHDIRGRILAAPLSNFLPEGVDSDTNTWQRIRVPMDRLRRDAAFAADRVKHITLRQNGADEQPHILWLDDLRLVSSNRAVVTQKPSAPKALVGRAGDRSITLHWEAVGNNAAKYRIYRRNGAGRFEIKGSPVITAGAADIDVENGRTYIYQVCAENEVGLSEPSAELAIAPKPFASDADFLEYLQATAFDYFWYEANPVNGLVRDRSQPWSAASIAATGFGLTGIGIGIDHAWITRENGAERVLRTLESLWSLPQGGDEIGTSGHRGWFYHFLDLETGTRFGTSELSSIDTALLLAGVLHAQEYFSNDVAIEKSIRQLAQNIFDRVDWKWMLNNGGTLAMGWHPERGFTGARWTGYNEASVLYLLGLGARGANSLAPEHWKNWCATYDWRSSFGYSFIHFAPLFGHQYSACWIDFRAIADDYTAAKNLTYFENSRRATLAQREYCIANPGKFPGYGPNVWGLTACDGPGSNGSHAYIARGAPPAENDDGTIAPTAAGGSLAFTPRESIAALRTMYDLYREQLWCAYGFRDAFNLKENWWGTDVIGIDQGPILIMAENFRTGAVWETMMKNTVLQQGLKRAGFRPFKAKPAPEN